MDSESRVCEQCSMPYQWRKSTSKYLKMTVCSYSCEKEMNGCTIEDCLAIERFGLSYTKLMEKYRNEAGLLLV